jgi:nitrogen fixation NifU-like protein
LKHTVYSARLLEHFRNPRNVGQLDPPAIVVDVTNPACGDILRLSVRVEGGRVAEARYQTRGCTASIAAGSALTEWLTGRSREEIRTLTAQTIEDLLDGLEPASKHAAVLCVDASKQFLKHLDFPAGLGRS